ncbi:MAG TPA: PqqD family peptide modification chaperone [Acidimicrobiales bacterium]
MYDDQVVRARSDQLVTKTVGDEIVVYDLATDKAHLLNPSAAAIWSLCQDGATVAELRAALEAELATNGTTDEILATALADLGAADLLVGAAQVSYSTPFISRRSLLKKAGIAAVALPAVTTILAPPAAATHTSGLCTGGGGGCTPGEHADCCPGTSCQSNGAGGNVCCNTALGGTCAVSDFCCQGTCTAGRCCNADGGSCTANTHCCGTSVCSGGACTPCKTNGSNPGAGGATTCCSGQLGTDGKCCGTAGGACTNSNQCCSGFVCTGSGSNKICTPTVP